MYLSSRGEDLTRIQGVGKELAGKIEEVVRTGDMSALQKRRERLPSGLLELLDLEGQGHKMVEHPVPGAGDHRPEDLKKSAGEGRIRELKGFGKNANYVSVTLCSSKNKG